MNPPSLDAFHHDRISPIQYVLPLPNQSFSWLLSDGRPMSVKTANDPPRDKQSLLASNHVSAW